ncbi:hypothetical protein [Elizabethkingia anophelis]|uniref:hypothetical protein n=1 Tax=Elizabethkingia anophelis TaxID=1117645 RepID=UPI0011EA7FEC|nr:hypothetical protein [Elizabethkingia anophelis]TYT27981.1 hypothetical protein FZC31_14420 [Elizabethkingia anophelis]UKY91299.1 hypothetical protein KUF64_06260 [Elizabethkingia anophelis]UKY98470.1 hypothetical protein KUF68_06270 [Elizabethkingia anophelis]
MISNANNFKTDKNRVIESHARKIMRYVIDCYHLILKDGKKYDYSRRGKIKQEDFLRNGLVDDYMRENIHLLNDKPINQYSIDSYINKESAESYYDAEDGLLHDDKIDIKIEYPNLKLDLKDRTAYFAIECKRITENGDSKEYISDTIKFSQRTYEKGRIPYEGQIGFIENSKISHSSIFPIINEKLKSAQNLTTIKELEAIKLKSDFEGSYRSLHEKSNETKDKFTVFHLFLNYLDIVQNN